MKCLMKELAGYKKEVFLIILTVLGTTLATLGLPALLSVLIDQAYINKDYPLVFKIGGFMIALVVVGTFCGIMTSRLSATVSMGVGRN